MRAVFLPFICLAVLASGCASCRSSSVRSPEPSAPAPPAPRPPAAPPADDRLPEFGEYIYVEKLPEAISKVDPIYPEDARKAGVEGMVMVQALVGKDGFVKDTRVIQSIPVLDDAAVDAVKQWVFKPAESKGQPVAVWVAVPVSFRLH